MLFFPHNWGKVVIMFSAGGPLHRFLREKNGWMVSDVGRVSCWCLVFFGLGGRSILMKPWEKPSSWKHHVDLIPRFKMNGWNLKKSPQKIQSNESSLLCIQTSQFLHSFQAICFTSLFPFPNRWWFFHLDVLWRKWMDQRLGLISG